MEFLQGLLHGIVFIIVGVAFISITDYIISLFIKVKEK
jgi:hypothetical protein